MLAERLAEWKSRLGYRFHRLAIRHTYLEVTRPDGSAGFCSFGCNRAVSHFARYYLDAGDAAVVRRRWYWRKQVDQMSLMAQRHGLALMSDELATSGLKKSTLSWPQLIELVVDIPDSLESYRKRLRSSAKSDLSRIRRRNFTYKVSRDPERLRTFHAEMYLPSMKEMHGENAYVFPLTDLLNILNRDPGCGLLELWSGNHWVGALLCEVEGRNLHVRRIGWRDGDFGIRRQGVSGAMHYFAIEEAIKHNCEKLFFGGVAPYLEDGLFHAKTKWLARLSYADSHYRKWHAMVDRSHPDCRSFFQNHSLLLKNETAKVFEVISLRAQADVKSAKKQADFIAGWHQLDEAETGGRPGILG